MHKNATKCNKTLSKWCKNKHRASKIIDTLETYQWSKAFAVVQGKLYKKSISGVFAKVCHPQEGQVILQDIHAGVYGHHASSRAIAAKAFRAGFYWLIVLEDAKDIVWRCEACQRFISRPHAPAAELQPIPLSWSFA
jgi:hypothetical protein